jgi:peptidoglycan/LPS O-acetylase OafA/YrhL
MLNALRFFLAIVVVTGHIASFVNGPRDWTGVGLWCNQGSAVFGFIVIDGYMCAERLALEPTRYLGWRFSRIYPIYLADLILVLLAYVPIGNSFRYPLGQGEPTPDATQIVGTLFMLQQFATVVIPLDGQTWSVACYWWFSMLACRFRHYPNAILLFLLGASYVTFLLFQHSMPIGMHTWTHGRAFLGAAWLWLTGFIWYRLKPTSLGCALVTIPAAIAEIGGYFIGLPLLITLFVLMVSGRVKLSTAVARKLDWLGDVSYPAYLCHTAVVALLCVNGITNSLVLTGASLLVAVLLVQFVDYPARRWLAGVPVLNPSLRRTANSAKS